jgi:hypothetical protein
MRSLLIAGTFALSAGACSSKDPTLIDLPDAARQCLIPTDYGALGTKAGTPDKTTANTLTIVLDPGPPKDDLYVMLVAGKGAFAGGALTTGTFPISGVDASFTDCGLCINVLADIVADQGPTKFYYADSGTVTLTQATATTGTTASMFAGSAQNLHFVEVNFATSAAIPGGCTSTIASITFGS